MATREKVVLAYSGGLDTSVLVRILSDEYKYDVIACHADVGESRDHEKLKAKARQAGAVAAEVIDAKEEFASEFCFPALQANALYQGVYPLSAALSRPLIAKHLVAAARKHGASAVAHGATGKGNDQVRFDLAVKGMAPDLKILAPQRERNITRDAAMEYAAKHGIEVPTSKKSPFSIDENLWGRSIEGGVLEDPAQEPPEAAFAWTRSIEAAPDAPGYLKIGFQRGLPVTVNGEKMSPATLIAKVGEIAGLHGVGRIDLMEDRVVGIKSRETYECPASVALIAAHQEAERFTVRGDALRVMAQLDQRFAQLTY
jgi:argininosuccinate synthase